MPLALLAPLALALTLFGAPLAFTPPELKGFNFSGGVKLIPETGRAHHRALDLYGGVHLGERARDRPSISGARTARSGGVTGLTSRPDFAPDRVAAGDARYFAAADEPIIPDEKFLARSRDWLSRSVRRVCGHVTDANRAGD